MKSCGEKNRDKMEEQEKTDTLTMLENYASSRKDEKKVKKYRTFFKVWKNQL